MIAQDLRVLRFGNGQILNQTERVTERVLEEIVKYLG
jgi:very-short-patch-repair endonuclease